MTDILTIQQRSRLMSLVRNKNTTPEKVVRTWITKAGFRFRLHGKNYPGKPDIVFPGSRKAVFVHGCFWHHHHNCRKGQFPSSNAQFWKDKIQNNMQRDKRVASALRRQGWCVATVWECETKNLKFQKRLSKFLLRTNGN